MSCRAPDPPSRPGPLWLCAALSCGLLAALCWVPRPPSELYAQATAARPLTYVTNHAGAAPVQPTLPSRPTRRLGERTTWAGAGGLALSPAGTAAVAGPAGLTAPLAAAGLVLAVWCGVRWALAQCSLPARQERAALALAPEALPRSGTMAMATTTAAPPPSAPRAPPAKELTSTGTTRNSKIRSSLEIPEGLKEFWYPVAFSSDLKPDALFPIEMFATSWVVFRDKEGAASCLRDECAHRACPLSIGSVKDGEVSCAYHGWTFDRDGSCTKMPSTSFNRGIRIGALPCREGDGFVWVWTGKGEPAPELPDWSRPPDGYTIHCEQIFEVPSEHGLLIENLLDLAHAPFTHTSTFAKGWPIPEAVKFHTSRFLAGDWDPYPINMSFEPPCAVLSTIGVEKPGDIQRGMKADECSRHLWQLHVCLPSSRGKTRLMYRMGLDFWAFTRHLPLMNVLWKNVAGQVLGEDLPLILGQQARMESGADVWANPVSYDKIGVRYRRWRNSLEDHDDQTRRTLEAELRRPFSSTELFMEGDALESRAGS